MVEDAFRKQDISNTGERFQPAVDKAKVRLDLAVLPGTWLMPSNLVLNAQSTVGHNDRLKKTSSDMKLGVNKSVSLEVKSVGVRHVNEGSSKIHRLISYPSKPISKTSTEVQVKTPPRLNETNHGIIKVGLFGSDGFNLCSFLPLLHYTRDMSSCSEQTPLPATFLLYFKEARVPKLFPRYKFW